MGFDSHSELAFNISISQLRSQKEDLRNLRNQSGMAATLSGLISTVFASMADFSSLLTKGTYFFLFLPVDFWFVVVCFCIALSFAALAAVDVEYCTFDLDANWILGNAADAKGISATYETLTKECEGYFQKNESVINNARFRLNMSILFSALLVPSWLCVLI
ncbi:MAG: hypothetical protein LPJ92_17565 [Rhodobacterales bacterium]|mgnify:CR=1 FL=1|nr:hypothetical protein [Rhodobacterales bacterium]MDX5392154.1 hypothetical protein [Rhodobacterales bacterium]MDX5491845.1 hypothetical protein [Rhodobacterales bacterium]